MSICRLPQTQIHMLVHHLDCSFLQSRILRAPGSWVKKPGRR